MKRTKKRTGKRIKVSSIIKTLIIIIIIAMSALGCSGICPKLKNIMDFINSFGGIISFVASVIVYINAREFFSRNKQVQIPYKPGKNAAVILLTTSMNRISQVEAYWDADGDDQEAQVPYLKKEFDYLEDINTEESRIVPHWARKPNGIQVYYKNCPDDDGKMDLKYGREIVIKLTENIPIIDDVDSSKKINIECKNDYLRAYCVTIKRLANFLAKNGIGAIHVFMAEPLPLAALYGQMMSELYDNNFQIYYYHWYKGSYVRMNNDNPNIIANE